MNSKPIVKLNKKKLVSVTMAKDKAEGYQWSLSVNIKPRKANYTIFQSITRQVYNKTGKEEHLDKHVFTEMWHKKRTGANVDAFLVPRWWRTPTKRLNATGYLEVEAKMWVVKDNVTFKSIGAVKGKLGDEPWGDTYGVYRIIKPPANTPYVFRHFKITWDNKVGTTAKHLKEGKDLKIVIDNETIIKPALPSPPSSRKSSASPELMVDAEQRHEIARNRSSQSPELYI